LRLPADRAAFAVRSRLVVALPVGAGFAVAVFAPLSLLPVWARGAWVPAAASGLWSAA